MRRRIDGYHALAPCMALLLTCGAAGSALAAEDAAVALANIRVAVLKMKSDAVLVTDRDSTALYRVVEVFRTAKKKIEGLDPKNLSEGPRVAICPDPNTPTETPTAEYIGQKDLWIQFWTDEIESAALSKFAESTEFGSLLESVIVNCTSKFAATRPTPDCCVQWWKCPCCCSGPPTCLCTN